MVISFRPLSTAATLAINVFPVPGGPYNKIPVRNLNGHCAKSFGYCKIIGKSLYFRDNGHIRKRSKAIKMWCMSLLFLTKIARDLGNSSVAVCCLKLSIATFKLAQKICFADGTELMKSSQELGSAHGEIQLKEDYPKSTSFCTPSPF